MSDRIPRRPEVAIILLSVFLTMSLFTGCGLITRLDQEETAVETTTPAHWSYEGDGGPEHWGDLDPAYAACSEGEHQSPIDFGEVTEMKLANISFDYRPSAINVVNNGHTIQVDYDAGSSISFDDAQYELIQFHFHAPSEHTVNGEPYAAELHLVHRNADGEIAVVGVLIDIGAEHLALEPIWANLPAKPGPAETIGASVNAADLLPLDERTFRYDGSLTTPPCSESVSWFVMIESFTMSDAQLTKFTEIIDENHRPVQPLNDREVLKDTSP